MGIFPHRDDLKTTDRSRLLLWPIFIFLYENVKIKMGNKGWLRTGGAHLAAERSKEERSGAKWRGRGLGRRNNINRKILLC